MTPDRARQASPQAAAAAPAPLALCLGGVFAAICALLLGPGVMVITLAESDAMHLMDAIARLRLGQVIHVDFRTPLGGLDLLAAAAWDAPVGRAMALGNITVMAALAPAAFWAGVSRLPFAPALALGAAVLALAGCMTWTPDVPGATPAMGYNRVGWAVALAALPLMILPRRRAMGAAGDWADGLVIGLLGGGAALVKIVYAVALAPLWLIWALAPVRRRAALVSLAAGLGGAAAGLLLLGGLPAAQGYVADLVMVAASGERPEPGLLLREIPVSIRNLPLTLAALAGLVALRRGGLAREGLAFLAATAALYVIAWQNWGNHVTGAFALPLILLALAPAADPSRRALGLPAPTLARAAAVALLALSAPPILGMARSLTLAWGDQENRAALLAPAAPDVLWDKADGAIRADTHIGGEDPYAVSLAGVAFSGCAVSKGLELLMAEGAARLRGDPALAGRTVLVASTVNALWLFAGAPPQKGAQLWVYAPLGETLREVEILAVPRCPTNPRLRRIILEEAAALSMRPVGETPQWVFFANGLAWAEE